ncbi:MAG: hypothetical protein ACUVV6_02940 [Thermoplasmatota archaeon]
MTEMTTAQAHTERKGSFSLSLRKIIEDVEARSGRKFTGRGLETGPAPVQPARAPLSRPHHPRSTTQLRLESLSSDPAADRGPELPCLSPLRLPRGGAREPSGERRAAGQVEGRGPRERAGRESLAAPAGGGSLAGSAREPLSPIIPLLPRLANLGDEAFMLLYLSASREFERRFEARGWCDRVLTMAARDR